MRRPFQQLIKRTERVFTFGLCYQEPKLNGISGLRMKSPADSPREEEVSEPSTPQGGGNEGKLNALQSQYEVAQVGFGSSFR